MGRNEIWTHGWRQRGASLAAQILGVSGWGLDAVRSLTMRFFAGCYFEVCNWTRRDGNGEAIMMYWYISQYWTAIVLGYCIV